MSRRSATAGKLQRRLGLRGTVAMLFAAGASLVSAVLSVGTYVTAETLLMGQRQSLAITKSFDDAAKMRDELIARNDQNAFSDRAPVVKALDQLAVPSDVGVVIFVDGVEYPSSLNFGSNDVPQGLRDVVAEGQAGFVVTDVSVVSQGQDSGKQRAIITGTPLPEVNAEFYEIAVTTEMNRVLDALPGVLSAVAMATTLSGALVGWWAARRALAPLMGVAQAAADIAGGDLQTRLAHTEDPELKTIVRSFNSMVDTVGERIERERRFTADVSHELRSPLTTLTTAVHLLKKRRDELSPQAGKAVDLIDTELGRFSRALGDLLELSRLDAGKVSLEERFAIDEIISHTISSTHRSTRVHIMEGLKGTAELVVLGDKNQLHRIFVNLLDNADKYADGATAVEIRNRDGFVVVHVDDSGEGIIEEDRERIFQRFVRSGSRRSIPGTGLGLSLVAEMVSAHGGSTVCGESPYGGARFTVRLPVAPPAELDEGLDEVEGAE